MPRGPRCSSRRSRGASVISVLLIAASPVLHGAGARAAPANDSAKGAREAFNEGQAAFNLGEWDKAIESWQRGYKLKQDSVFLYNIAQAYRKAGNLEQAIFFYRNFLRNTSTAPNRDEVTGWVEQLEKQLAEERQRKADEAQRRQAAEEQARKDEAVRLQRAEEASRQRAAAVESKRSFKGDLGLSAGANLWLAGLRDKGIAPSASIELSGGYTLVKKGRLSFRLGATVGWSYLSDLSGSTVNLFGLLVDPRLRVDVWHERLFVFAGVGLGAFVISNLSSASGSALIDVPNRAARGSFAGFEARPELGVGYQIIPRLSVTVAPGVVLTTSPEAHIPLGLRLQVMAGVQVHL